MFRMTTLKISLFSALATLFLLVAMLASASTASAHTASHQATAFTPHLYVYDDMVINGGCKEMLVKSIGFAPGPVTLVATRKGHPLIVSPNVETANSDGYFSGDVIICGDGFGTPHLTGILVGTDHNGVQSNQVLV